MPSADQLAWFFGNVSPFQIVTAVMASVGTVAGFYGIYKLYWEGPRIEIHSGDRLYLVGPVGNTAPINATLAIINHGSRTGVLQFLEMHVTTPKGSSEIFEWAEFYKYEEGSVVVKEFDPHPVSVAPKGNMALRVQFVLRTTAAFEWTPGQYRAIVLGWVGRRSRQQGANVETSFRFRVTEQEAEMLSIIPGGRRAVYFTVRVQEWA